MKSNSFFNKHEIETAINKKLNVCRTLKFYKETTSTQTIAKEQADKGFHEGLVVIAEQQTKGYGRNKAIWSSNAGGLWFSMLLKPKIHPKEASKLTLLLSTTLKIVLEEKYEVDSEIKWPNDVLVFGKKIAGVLIEMSAEHNIINWIVAGVGININNSLPKELESTSISLKDILKKEVSRTEFIAEFLMKFEDLYFNFQKDRVATLQQAHNSNHN
jgi:BirA family biotin operon repressor/biotin-[acetyl-CoA-carboxylase] ligase